MKTVLTIAGSDCSGGAGIQADLKTIAAHGLYGMSVITALTAQNTMGISDVCVTPDGFVRKQLESIFSDIRPDAVKIGMVASREQMKSIMDILEREKPKRIVMDPVLFSTSGSALTPYGEDEVWNRFLHLATVLTPNIPEAELLTGNGVQTREDMEKAAELLSKRYGAAILLKGGHRKTDAADFFYENGRRCWLEGVHILNDNTHGTGCTLSSAIACNLAQGASSEQAVRAAKAYITGAISDGLQLGKGNGPLNHMYRITQEVRKI